MPEFDRRDFLKLVGVGAGATVASACSDPVEYLIPYVVQPEVITPGIPNYWASTCRECPAGCGVHVTTREGRPLKLEGNPGHPVNRGALCGRGQAGLGRTYHPDRFRGPQTRSAQGELTAVAWDAAISELAAKVKAAGAGTFVLGADPGPAAAEQIDRWVAAVGAGGRVVYEPFAPEALREATDAVFGVDSLPVFDLSAADLVISFGDDLLETGVSPVEHARQLAAARDARTRKDGGARFVYVGPRLSLTTSNADEWLPAKPGTEGILALALARVALASGKGTASDRAALGSLLDPFDPQSRSDTDGCRCAGDRACRPRARRGQGAGGASSGSGAHQPAGDGDGVGRPDPQSGDGRSRQGREGAAGRPRRLSARELPGDPGARRRHEERQGPGPPHPRCRPALLALAGDGVRRGPGEGAVRGVVRIDSRRDHESRAPDPS